LTVEIERNASFHVDTFLVVPPADGEGSRGDDKLGESVLSAAIIVPRGGMARREECHPDPALREKDLQLLFLFLLRGPKNLSCVTQWGGGFRTARFHSK
jgi:hypothetical protein